MAYNGIESLRGPYEKLEYTQEQIEEYKKCRDDFFYFCENYCYVVLNAKKVPLVLRDYQRKLIQDILDNKYVIGCWSRQSGKCVLSNTLIKIRNKKTGEIRDITIGDFHSLINNKSGQDKGNEIESNKSRMDDYSKLYTMWKHIFKR